MNPNVPIVLFVYARPDHLHRTLESLRANKVSLIYIFSDGPKTPDKGPAVNEVRKIVNEIDWCKTIITERETNLGLGRSILTGVTQVLQKEEAVIVFEDDLICVPGTYEYISDAILHYQNDNQVMSVTGWTHPLVTPKDVTDNPYFDGRAECWVWGTWARAWKGMRDNDALSLLKECEQKGIDVYKYGADLPAMAINEQKQNIWAVRFLYWHIFNQGLCLRPPWSMVEHIGFDKEGTNVQSEIWTKNPPLRSCPPIPEMWPEPVENPECSALHQKVCGRPPNEYEKNSRVFINISFKFLKIVYWLRMNLYVKINNKLKSLLPSFLYERMRVMQRNQQEIDISGKYNSWEEAQNASTGYKSELILEKTRAALLKVKNGEAEYERDSVLFDEIQYSWPLLASLMWVASQSNGVLNVLDFGGSLGSTYYQNRAFLHPLPKVQWSVVEQSGHVNVGKEYFEDEVLKFFPNIEICLSYSKPNVILVSSVLQYLESPYELFTKLLDLPCNYVIIDRTSFWDGSTDLLCVQKVPPRIYPASYPIWIFSEQNFLKYINNMSFEVIAKFQSLDNLKSPVSTVWKGMILKRK